MSVVVRSGLASADRTLPRPERREVTRQFRSPVFDHSADELRARVYLAARYQDRSDVARARLRTVHYVMTSGVSVSPKRALLTAFDAQNRAVLGVEP